MATLEPLHEKRLTEAGWEITYDHGNVMLFRESDRVSASILDISLRTGGKHKYFVINAYQNGHTVSTKTVFSVTAAVVFVLNYLQVGFTPYELVG